MRLARVTAGYVPAHARPASAPAPSLTREQDRTRHGRLRRWRPVLIIGAIYLVAIVANEWRLQRHVQDLRDPGSAPVVEPAPPGPGQFAGAG